MARGKSGTVERFRHGGGDHSLYRGHIGTMWIECFLDDGEVTRRGITVRAIEGVDGVELLLGDQVVGQRMWPRHG